MARSIWIGKDEHEGVLAQPRKDLEPPAHWRLEAVAHTPRPRSLDVVGGRAVFIEDGGDTSDLFLLDLDAGGPPRRLTTGREPMPHWEDTQPRLSPDGTRVAYGDGAHVWLVPTARGPLRPARRRRQPAVGRRRATADRRRARRHDAAGRGRRRRRVAPAGGRPSR